MTSANGLNVIAKQAVDGQSFMGAAGPSCIMQILLPRCNCLDVQQLRGSLASRCTGQSFLQLIGGVAVDSLPKMRSQQKT